MFVLLGLVPVLLAAQPGVPRIPQPQPLHIPPALASAARAPQAPAPALPQYRGHGLQSIPAGALARFAPKPAPAAIQRAVQAQLDVRFPSPGVLSADAKILFFNWTVSGTSQLWKIEGPDRFPRQLTAGEDTTTLFEVTPDGQTLIAVRDRKGEEDPGLYLQNAKGGSLELIQHLPGIQTQPLHLSDDGKTLFFRSNDQKKENYALYQLDIATRQKSVLWQTDGLWTLWDRAKDGRVLIAKQTGAVQFEVFEFNPKDKVLTPLLGQGEQEDYVASYGAGDEILVRTPKLGEFRRVYQFDRITKALTPVTPNLPYDITRHTVDRAKKRLWVTVNEGGFTRLRSFDAKSKRELPLPPLLSKLDHVHLGAVTRDGRYATLLLDPGDDIPYTAVLDTTTGEVKRWQHTSAPEFETKNLARAKLETYPARDGTPIPAFVRRPPTCATSLTPCPVVIDFHGGPEGQSQPGYNTRAQLFVDAGFIWVEPNVRGSEGYGKSWGHADDGAKRLNVITDIEDAALHIRKTWGKNGVAPRIGIMGGSYGGYSTLMGMTRFAGAYDAGVEVVGISNLLSFLENTAPYRRALRISEYGDPVKDKAALIELSPITHIDKIRGPLLLIQGANDPRVPVGEALQLYSALEKKRTGVEMIIFPDEGHGAKKRENIALILAHTIRFFNQHLKP